MHALHERFYQQQYIVFTSMKAVDGSEKSEYLRLVKLPRLSIIVRPAFDFFFNPDHSKCRDTFCASSFLQTHLGECSYVRVACIFPACGVLVKRSDLAFHLENECSERVMTCSYCAISVPLSSLKVRTPICFQL
jgi:hypothetical protein